METSIYRPSAKMRPPLPPPVVVALVLLVAWSAVAAPEASALSEESTLETADDLVGPGEEEGYRVRLEEGQDELDVVGASKKVTKRHGDSQVRILAPHIKHYISNFTLTLALLDMYNLYFVF